MEGLYLSQFEFILAREAQLMYRRATDFEPVAGNLTRWRGSIPGRDQSKNMNFEVEIHLTPEFPRTPPKVLFITPADHPQITPGTGELSLRILSFWRPEYHLYQVVNSIKGLFARIPPKIPEISRATPSKSVSTSPIPTPTTQFFPAAQMPPPYTPRQQRPHTHEPEIPEEPPHVKELKNQISGLEDELNSLQKTLISKTEEIARLEGRMTVHNVPAMGPNRINEILHASTDKDSQLLDLQSEKIALEDLIQTLENKFENGDINSSEYAKLYKSYQKQLNLVNTKIKELGNNP